MAYHYSTNARKRSPHLLPDLEVFKVGPADVSEDPELFPASGWYYWWCSPGCMPEGDGMAYGPYKSERAALAEARDGYYWCGGEDVR